MFDQEDRQIQTLTEIMLASLLAGFAFAVLAMLGVIVEWDRPAAFCFAAGTLSLGVFVVTAILLFTFMMGEEEDA